MNKSPTPPHNFYSTGLLPSRVVRLALACLLGSASFLLGQEAAPAAGTANTIPLPTITNADVHKFVISNSLTVYAGVEKLYLSETVRDRKQKIDFWVWGVKHVGKGVWFMPDSVTALRPEDQKYVQEWAARYGPDGQTFSSPAPAPGEQRLACFSRVSNQHSFLVDTSGVLKGKTITAIAGDSMALCSDGTLVTWGGNEFGQLGNGRDGLETLSIEPVRVDLSPMRGRKITAIAATQDARLAVCEDGSLFVWGSFEWNKYYPGETTAIAHNRPALYDEGALKGRKVVAVAIGYENCLALCTDGRMVEWGSNPTGDGKQRRMPQLYYPPILVDNSGALKNKTVVKIAIGVASSAALCSDGSLVFWGKGGGDNVAAGRKALGVPNPGPAAQNSGGGTRIPLPLVDETGVLQGKTVTDIQCANEFIYALCSDGALVGWDTYTEPVDKDPAAIYAKNNRFRLHPNPIVVSGQGVLKGKTVLALGPSSSFSLNLKLLLTDNELFHILDVEGAYGSTGVTHVNEIDPAHILANRKIQSFTAGGLVLFQEPGAPEEPAPAP